MRGLASSRPFRLQALAERLDLLLHHCVRLLERPRARDNYHVIAYSHLGSRPILSQPAANRVAEPPLGPIPSDRPAHPLAHRNPHPQLRRLGADREGDQRLSGIYAAGSQHPLEIALAPKAKSSLHPGGPVLSFLLRGQAVAAAATAVLQDPAASGLAHLAQKTVDPPAITLLGLVRALDDRSPRRHEETWDPPFRPRMGKYTNRSTPAPPAPVMRGDPSLATGPWTAPHRL